MFLLVPSGDNRCCCRCHCLPPSRLSISLPRVSVSRSLAKRVTTLARAAHHKRRTANSQPQTTNHYSRPAKSSFVQPSPGQHYHVSADTTSSSTDGRGHCLGPSHTRFAGVARELSRQCPRRIWWGPSWRRRWIEPVSKGTRSTTFVWEIASCLPLALLPCAWHKLPQESPPPRPCKWSTDSAVRDCKLWRMLLAAFKQVRRRWASVVVWRACRTIQCELLSYLLATTSLAERSREELKIQGRCVHMRTYILCVCVCVSGDSAACRWAVRCSVVLRFVLRDCAHRVSLGVPRSSFLVGTP